MSIVGFSKGATRGPDDGGTAMHRAETVASHWPPKMRPELGRWDPKWATPVDAGEGSWSGAIVNVLGVAI